MPYVDCNIELRCTCGHEFIEVTAEHTDNLPEGEPTYPLDAIPTCLVQQLVGDLVCCTECEKAFVITNGGDNGDGTTRMYLERA